MIFDVECLLLNLATTANLFVWDRIYHRKQKTQLFLALWYLPNNLDLP